MGYAAAGKGYDAPAIRTSAHLASQPAIQERRVSGRELESASGASQTRLDIGAIAAATAVKSWPEPAASPSLTAHRPRWRRAR